MADTSPMRTGSVEYLNPDGLVRSPAFTNVAVVAGAVKTIYIGGQDAVTADGQLVGKGDLGAQTTQIVRNLETALAAAGASLEHLVKLTILIVEGQDALVGFRAWQEIWGDRPNPPLITTAFVAGLAQPDWLAEIDAIAVVPV